MLKKEINLMSYEDILGETGQIKEIPLTELHEFTKHPYQVREDKEFEELVQSIKEHGILTPGVARERAEASLGKAETSNDVKLANNALASALARLKAASKLKSRENN